MRYFYVDENDHTAGPVEEASFYEALRIHVLAPGTEVVAEGTEEWQTLAEVVTYYFTYGEGSAGPLPLAKLMHLAAASDEPLMIMEPEGSEWQSLEDLVSAVASAVAEALPENDAPELSSGPRAVQAAISELKAENEALKRRMAALEAAIRRLQSPEVAAASPAPADQG